MRLAFYLALCLSLSASAIVHARCTDSKGENCPGIDQVESFVSTSCPGPSGAFHDTDLVAVIETRGEPIVVNAAFQVVMSPNSGANIRVSIDGMPDTVTARHFIGEFQGETTTLNLTRLFEVPAGEHVIILQASCQPAVAMSERWLSVHAIR